MCRFNALLVLIFICSLSGFSQESMNYYKYILVPTKYDFQKSEDQYQINSLVKFLFEKEEFNVYLKSEDLPADLSENRCLALTANLINQKGMFGTKVNFEMLDCNDKVIFTAKVGKNNIKTYKDAYNDAIRKSFEDIKSQNYKYAPKEPETIEIVPVAVATTAVVSTEKDVVDAPVTSTNTESNNENNSNVAIPVMATVAVVSIEKAELDSAVLYAQEIAEGYQVVDGTPKVIYIALRTSVKDVYLIKGSDGIIYKSDQGWVAQEYVDGELVSKVLNIKLLE